MPPMCRSYLGRHWGTENRKQHATYRNRLKNTDSNCAKSGLMSGLDTPPTNLGTIYGRTDRGGLF